MTKFRRGSSSNYFCDGFLNISKVIKAVNVTK